MKKLIVAVSAIMAFGPSFAGNMADWVSNKPKQAPAPVQNPNYIEKVEPLKKAETIAQVDKNITQNQIQNPPANHDNKISEGPINQNQVRREQPRSLREQAAAIQQQKSLNTETQNEERIARSMEQTVPRIISLLNAPSLSAEQKQVGFQYMGALSQMLTNPQDMVLGATQANHNDAIACAGAKGMNNILITMRDMAISDQYLAANYNYALKLGGFAQIGQSADASKCS